ncbi:aldehyde dehydrogenase family protein [Rhizobium sp. ARZ01]|uniref:aldehyde dehydrogenase family protein n=1 Tax=Rhizobium sp. ARZ01 TaxID=2769313 RepID=UPI00177B1028|nr:aldehyde dehydrogenase family protein [Rhizobium sp. ARZ01]
MTKKYSLLINGKLVDGARTIDILNPATEAVVAACPVASPQQADEAVQAAKAAQQVWARTSIDERRQVLNAIADRIEQNSDSLARLLTAEQGKPLGDSNFEVGYLAYTLRQISQLNLPVEVSEDSDRRRVEIHYRPLGVVVGIIPWNFPIGLIGNKLPGALLTGNSVIIKPAPTTPLSTLLLGEILVDVVPPGLVNVIADANDLGEQLTRHPDVAKISFTGSTATGRKVMEAASPGLKRLTLELGGNDPAIVLDDVDPKTAAAGIFQYSFVNSGQICVAIKRAYVHTGVYDAVVDELTTLANQATVGDGSQQGVQFGPIQNQRQYEKALHYLEIGKRDGRVTTGDPELKGPGYFIKPTIVRDIDDASPLVKEEQFAPILPVIRYETEEDAIERANSSEFGLGASVWSRSSDRAADVASRLDAGTVWINQHLDLGPTIPLAPGKQSGLGVEMGIEGLKHFCQMKVINISKQV